MALAAKGTEVIVTGADGVRARLVPVPASKPSLPPIPDLHPGAIEIAEDFDDPLPDDFWLGRM
jgi:antitoxin (DNA-binding transcriptional repressor) of toxin-antitoxin stability system